MKQLFIFSLWEKNCGKKTPPKITKDLGFHECNCMSECLGHEWCLSSFFPAIFSQGLKIGNFCHFKEKSYENLKSVKNFWHFTNLRWKKILFLTVFSSCNSKNEVIVERDHESNGLSNKCQCTSLSFTSLQRNCMPAVYERFPTFPTLGFSSEVHLFFYSHRCGIQNYGKSHTKGALFILVQLQL